MSESENPERTDPRRGVTADDVREIAGAATPHFAMQIRNRLRRLVAPLPVGDPARQRAEAEIARLERLAIEGRHGQRRGSDLESINGHRP